MWFPFGMEVFYSRLEMKHRQKSIQTRREISAKLKGRSKTPEHRSAISSAMLKVWAEKKSVPLPEKNKIDFFLERDKARWASEAPESAFDDWLREQTLTVSRSRYLHPDGLVVYTHRDPVDGKLLHVGLVADQNQICEFRNSSLRRNKRLKQLFTSGVGPVVEVVKSGIEFSEARKLQLYIMREERSGGGQKTE